VPELWSSKLALVLAKVSFGFRNYSAVMSFREVQRREIHPDLRWTEVIIVDFPAFGLEMTCLSSYPFSFILAHSASGSKAAHIIIWAKTGLTDVTLIV
jgi:hypothetical protein